MRKTASTIIRFEPLMPVRQDVIGERVFTSEWQHLVGGKRATVMHWAEDGSPRWEDFGELGSHRGTPWLGTSFYRSMSRIGSFPADLPLAEAWQRRASVATSFIKWLGTNIGRTFLEDADKTYDALKDARLFPNYRSSAYAMAWARRNNDTDGQQRLTIVAESYETGHHGMAVLDKYACSYDDIRVIEEMAAWLGTDSGQRFVKTCRLKIGRAAKRDKSRRHAAENIRLLGLGLKPAPAAGERPANAGRTRLAGLIL